MEDLEKIRDSLADLNLSIHILLSNLVSLDENKEDILKELEKNLKKESKTESMRQEAESLFEKAMTECICEADTVDTNTFIKVESQKIKPNREMKILYDHWTGDMTGNSGIDGINDYKNEIEKYINHTENQRSFVEYCVTLKGTQ